MKKYILLCLSIFIDIIGVLTYIIPGIGEFFDVIWAPISAILLQLMYGNMFFTILNFVEEIIPGFDFIPTALIAWFITYGGVKNKDPNNTNNKNKIK